LERVQSPSQCNHDSEPQPASTCERRHPLAALVAHVRPTSAREQHPRTRYSVTSTAYPLTVCTLESSSGCLLHHVSNKSRGSVGTCVAGHGEADSPRAMREKSRMVGRLQTDSDRPNKTSECNWQDSYYYMQQEEGTNWKAMNNIKNTCIHR
jgi:hypothetical protein